VDEQGTGEQRMSEQAGTFVAPEFSVRRAALTYALGRFGVFALLALLIWSATGFAGRQLNGLPLLLVALLLSSVVSYFLFSRQRKQLATALAAQREAKTEQIAQRRARLDDDRA
jgi:hypothetical protein